MKSCHSWSLRNFQGPLQDRSRGGEVIECAGNVTDEQRRGYSLIAPAESVSGAEYRRVLEINLVAPFLLAKAFGIRMLATGRGIINVASVAVLVGIADRTATSFSYAL